MIPEIDNGHGYGLYLKLVPGSGAFDDALPADLKRRWRASEEWGTIAALVRDAGGEQSLSEAMNWMRLTRDLKRLALAFVDREVMPWVGPAGDQ